MSEKSQSVGFVVPTIFGGSAVKTSLPILLVPSGQSGPCDKSQSRPLPKEERGDQLWYFVGTQKINGADFDAYSTMYPPAVEKSEKHLSAFLGDKLKRASKDEARNLVKAEATRAMDQLVANFKKSRPDLEELDTQSILRMILGG